MKDIASCGIFDHSHARNAVAGGAVIGVDAISAFKD